VTSGLGGIGFKVLQSRNQWNYHKIRSEKVQLVCCHSKVFPQVGMLMSDLAGEVGELELRSIKRQQNDSFHPVVPRLLAATVHEYVQLTFPPQMQCLTDFDQAQSFTAGRCETEGSGPSESPTMQSNMSSQAQSWDP
jgi:hypothetical protein